MATVQLSNTDARLAYLAVQYHLGRPGSELDPETKQPKEHGLAEVAQALEPQLEQAVAEIELNDDQRRRLISGVAGSVNELKTYALLAEGQHSTVPAFHQALRRLFPDVRDEPEEATQLAAHLVSLRRKLERTAGPAAAEPAKERPWWRFWGRKGA
ncbi:MAG: hypothetical protein Q8S13_08540 [Dehalococcoidia bacterium]|nr:hypothetical protein [Dehalococcoidia bacterium]